MKKVIDGKIYNTETADRICELPCSFYMGDFGYHETYLYRTQKGAYFLAGRGGPASRWAERAGNSGYSGGSGLHVVDMSEARDIVERACLSPEEMTEAGFAVEEA